MLLGVEHICHTILILLRSIIYDEYTGNWVKDGMTIWYFNDKCKPAIWGPSSHFGSGLPPSTFDARTTRAPQSPPVCLIICFCVTVICNWCLLNVNLRRFLLLLAFVESSENPVECLQHQNQVMHLLILWVVSEDKRCKSMIIKMITCRSCPVMELLFRGVAEPLLETLPPPPPPSRVSPLGDISKKNIFFRINAGNVISHPQCLPWKIFSRIFFTFIWCWLTLRCHWCRNFHKMETISFLIWPQR